MNTKYEIRVYAKKAVEQQALIELGFTQDWDHEPYRLRTDNWEDVDVITNVLVQDGFTCNFQVEKKEEK